MIATIFCQDFKKVTTLWRYRNVYYYYYYFFIFIIIIIIKDTRTLINCSLVQTQIASTAAHYIQVCRSSL